MGTVQVLPVKLGTCKFGSDVTRFTVQVTCRYRKREYMQVYLGTLGRYRYSEVHGSAGTIGQCRAGEE